MPREVYYRLIDKHGALVLPAIELESLLAADATKLSIIQSRILNYFSNTVLNRAVPHDLTLYSNDAARVANEALNAELPVASLVGPDEPLVVMMAPSILDAPVPGMELCHVKINPNEFQLDQLNEKVGTLVETPGLPDLFTGFGEFPSTYYVRKEEAVFWTVIEQRIPLLEDEPLVMVGSLGVGKSCFLMVLALYLACIHHRKVLVIRRVQDDEAVVFLNGLECVVLADSTVTLPVQRAFNIPIEVMNRMQKPNDLLMLADGYTADGINGGRYYLQLFDVLAISCQYAPIQDNPSRLVVLPAW